MKKDFNTYSRLSLILLISFFVNLNIFIAIAILFSSCATTTSYYIVRHAEKDAGTTMTTTVIQTSDVPLSEKGMKMAQVLSKQLERKRIKQIYSTNTIRTKSTAEPLSKLIGIPIQIYNNVDSSFVQRLKSQKGNVLVVGHSNTVDDLVNALTNKKLLNDLPDAQYGDIFIVHKKGNSRNYEIKRYD
jgi:broad specificity phosphatase PhoE